MKKIVSAVFALAAVAVWSGDACAALRSPLPSDVPGITIPNTHLVAKGVYGAALRGNAPAQEEVRQLKDYGITDVLIFKTQTSTEVDQEKAWLTAAGYPAERIYQVPFPWKDLGPFKQTCEQTISALQVLINIYNTPGRAVFFHCTVGEDRTGYLAGLFRMLVSGWNTDQAFRAELCKNGYEAGDPNKEDKIVQIIRAELTPAYLKMAYLISTGTLTSTRLDAGVCNAEPQVLPATLAKYKCWRPRVPGKAPKKAVKPENPAAKPAAK